jgi:hypothetical protein
VSQLNNYKTSIKPISQGKNALLTLVVYVFIIYGYQTSCHQEIWQKLVGEKNALIERPHPRPQAPPNRSIG